MVQMFMPDLKKVSDLWSVRFRVSDLERFCYNGFFRNSSGAKFFVHLREASALVDVRFREVPLYLLSKSIRNGFFKTSGEAKLQNFLSGANHGGAHHKHLR